MFIAQNLKKLVGVVITALLLATCLLAAPAYATELDESVRTLPLDGSGETYTLTLQQVQTGKRLFNNACATCHAAGVTKTNPNVGLDPEALSYATPRRDNIEALVDYMQNPTTYDGLVDISELHPSTKSADIFPIMRNLTDEDLFAIAGHILLQPKVSPDRWGRGKAYR